MIRTIDELMFINDGHIPFSYLFVGKGGLGFEPTEYNIKGSGYLDNIHHKILKLENIQNKTKSQKKRLSELFPIKHGTLKRMKGGMIGGMPYRDINNPDKNVYEFYNDKEDAPNLVDIDEFIDKKDEFIDDETYKQDLLQHLQELPELVKDAYIENNDEYEKSVIGEFNKLYKEAKKLNLNEEEKKITKDIKKSILDIQKKNTDELLEERLNRDDNEFYDKMKELGIKSANEITNKFINGNQDERKAIVDEWLGKQYEVIDKNNKNKKVDGNEIRKKFDDLKSDDERKKFLFDIISVYEKGNKSEDKLIDKEILLSFIDKDFSKIYDTKEEQGLNPDFIKVLKDIGLSSNEIKNQVLKKINIDAVKDNTVWELKAFGKNSYSDDYSKRYSKAKFFGSEPFKIRIEKANGKFDLYELDYKINDDLPNEKIKNITFTLRYPKKPWETKQIIKVGNILKPNPNGYNYYIMENNQDTIQYINPYKKNNWKNLEQQFINPNNKKANIPNKELIKFPRQYVDNFNKIRLKKNIRLNKKEMYKNWDKIKI